MNKNWTREETLVAFNAYCKIPFKNSSKTHPLILQYAQILGRTPSALNMKIGNLGRLDPELHTQGISGLTHGAKVEEDIWRAFYADPERLAFESEALIARLSRQPIEVSASIRTDDLPQGTERTQLVRQRVHQSFFRAAVMSSYNFRCCISGIHVPELVEVCHIVDWAQSPTHRTNPQNGLCLNPFFHKAYDQHLLSITPDFDIVISDELMQQTADNAFRAYLQTLHGERITLPDRFLPQRDFLDMHHRAYLSRWA